MELEEQCLSSLKDIEDCLTLIKQMPMAPLPIYENTNKAAAYICYRLKKYDYAAYYLSEAHGGGVRSKLSLLMNPDKTSNKELDKCLSMNSEYASKGYSGLIERLREMPSEWTLVQITRNYNPKEIITPRPADEPMDVCELFITRYQCGQNIKNNIPLTVKINKPKCSLGQKNIFQVLKTSLEDTNNKKIKDHAGIRRLRDAASQSIKNISEEIHTSWLKHWICMLLGNYVDEKLAANVYSIIDNIIEKEKITISDRTRMLLYQITNASIQLTNVEIKNVLRELDCSIDDKIKFENAIIAYQSSSSNLMLKKRHPVLLILDEHLECLPWETIPYLKRHPISRVSSVHIVHSLYTKHKDSIENGLMKIKNQGYYILNPDKSLFNAEQRISSFLKERQINWPGIKSQEPTSGHFSSVLQNNNIILYCGHGNGTQYLHSLDLEKLDLRCIPMLFGCSSVKHIDKGGRPNFVGASYGYLKAGCPCVIGMLWNVMSLDADNLARALLNVWYPGNPINLQKMWPKEFLDEQDYNKEPELLRTLSIARKTTRSYFNYAALVARGIPVIMTDDK
ncbi:SEPARIN core domain [Cinara cedri]|uniref:separase n=1 Tax=Cinara cedri TaxID=506608 RepID=A0A5E4M2Q7_9HEMI|nr:SEPARIN core domain [Cinara cedri]